MSRLRHHYVLRLFVIIRFLVEIFLNDIVIQARDNTTIIHQASLKSQHLLRGILQSTKKSPLKTDIHKLLIEDIIIHNAVWETYTFDYDVHLPNINLLQLYGTTSEIVYGPGIPNIFVSNMMPPNTKKFYKKLAKWSGFIYIEYNEINADNYNHNLH